ncbi:CU044_5270 family protein [Actinomadura fibrosa]|uniref:CU044_5270 family protein n=1 Tax=Actinomadura fibrosa TaxID=111802 RepID=A0ABW2XAY4_9ACTN|nr:CU044_5270 family protein [Actinomadura fibrosa]
MDELQMIATMLDEPPAPESEAAGRRALTEGIRNPRRPRRAPARLRWPVLGGLGLGAVAASVAGAVLLSSGTAPRAPGAPQAEPMSARTVLLSAAGKAESAPASGKYWHVKTVFAIPTKVGPKKNPYWMDSQRVDETWATRDGRSWTGFREVGARPHTPADASAWKRDGSPTKWNLGRADTTRGETLVLSVAPKQGGLIAAKGGDTFSVCERALTFKQVQALPAEPGALKDRLAQYLRTSPDGAPQNVSDGLGQCLVGLLADVPAPPKVRGAAYRALAALPAVKAAGRTTDDRGRKGVALVVTGTGRAPVVRLVVDPATSLVLSRSVEQTGKLAAIKQKSVKTTFLEAGWTDAGPHVPSVP